MKLSETIKALQALQKQLKTDPDLVIDHDENGYFDLEEVQLKTCEDQEIVINLKSSNEA